uniref:hypothetical protein n=1 Tax=Rhodaphanes brevistipitata TaxID=446136 RepID=UPI001FCDE7FF|nr:hypothetical protein MW432_pgp173 [Rhodaphanes brevistipitata]UNJ18408.1 hypothetical protein [Rhodaphanes brevistipitata]
MYTSIFEKELILLIKSYYSVIYIQSVEEERLENSLKKIIKSNFQYSIYSWDFIRGYNDNPNDLGFASNNPIQALDLIEQLVIENSAVFILKDFHLFLKDLGVQRKIRNLSQTLKNKPIILIIIASELNIPNTLTEVITVLDFPLPNEVEITKELNQLFTFLQITMEPVLFSQLVRACQGLSIDRIRRVFSKIFAEFGQLSAQSLQSIITEKKQIISQTQILEFYSNKEKIENIGGLENLKQWLQRRSNSFSDQAKRYGIPAPKGVLLVGIQGTGKSLTAKAIASEWKLPLIRLDTGKLFGGLVGESESKMRQMIQLSEAMAPCVLWIDELDKAFSGIESKADSGTTSRVLGTFLTWLSEKKSQVFIVATANNINSLPPEILRKGRMDEIFFLGLPNREERALIFQVHLEKVRPKSWFKYDISTLSYLTENFSGAEIEQVIIEAMHLAFSEQKEFETKDIVQAIKSFVPLVDTYKEQVEILEEWSLSGKIRNASKID